jgi:hypothetical protein
MGKLSHLQYLPYVWNPSVLNLLPSQQLRLPTSFFLPSNNVAEPGCPYGECVRCFGRVDGKPPPGQGKTLHQIARSSGSESGLAATIEEPVEEGEANARHVT